MSASRRTTRGTGLAPLVAAAAREKSVEALAARHGAAADRPALASHLVVRRQNRMGEVTWVVKNPQRNAYYNFTDAEWGIIELFDGSRTREEIVEEYLRLFPAASVDVGFVLGYEEMLRNVELLEQSAAERSLTLLQKSRAVRQRTAEEKSEGFNPFFIMFHVLNPDRFLNRTVRYVRWLWTPPLVIAWSIAGAWTVGVFALHFSQIWSGTYELYAFLRKPLLDALQFFVILSIIGGIHEFGHAYATKNYGGEVRDIGIALLYFTPAFYCDTTDSLLFENKWHRLWVTTAGIYVEGFICSAATALWVASYSDTLLHEIAYKTMLFTGVSTVFFNINPLIKIDGYYALANYLEIPELREESFRYLGALFQKRILRLSVEVPAASRRKRRIYWVYGTLALAYTVVLMRFIGGLFHNLYSRYFPDIAVVLLLLTLYRVYRKRVRLVTRTARLFYLDKKELFMARKNRRWILMSIAGVLLALVLPWRRTVLVESSLRPVSLARVEAPEDGWVLAVRFAEGGGIRKGEEIFRLESAAVHAEAARSAAAENRFRKAASAARGAAAAGELYEIEHRSMAAQAALRSGRSREARLSVESPISGLMLTPRVGDLENRFVVAGTLLAEIGDCRQLVADLPVSERLLDDIAVGAAVRALAGQQPLRPVRGKIVSVSAASLDSPRTVVGLADPKAPVERPDQFIARALFDNGEGTLRPGDTVRARIDAGRSSLLGRSWRVLWRWLKMVAW